MIDRLLSHYLVGCYFQAGRPVLWTGLLYVFIADHSREESERLYDSVPSLYVCHWHVWVFVWASSLVCAWLQKQLWICISISYRDGLCNAPLGTLGCCCVTLVTNTFFVSLFWCIWFLYTYAPVDTTEARLHSFYAPPCRGGEVQTVGVCLSLLVMLHPCSCLKKNWSRLELWSSVTVDNKKPSESGQHDRQNDLLWL